jgi:hypothetical protein
MMIQLLVHKKGIEQSEEYFGDFLKWLAERVKGSVGDVVGYAIKRHYEASTHIE